MRTTRQYLFVAGLILILAVFNQCKNRSQGDSLMRTIDNNNQFITHVEKEYFINGGLKAVYEINNGKKNGQYIEYYQDSTLKYKQYYQNVKDLELWNLIQINAFLYHKIHPI